MRKLLSQGILLAVVVAVSVTATGCSQYYGLKAKRTFRDANGLYQSNDYKPAAAKYEQVVALDTDTLNKFNLTPSYFFLANSSDNLYRGAKKGDATNDAYMTKAVENYKKDADLDPDPKMKKLSLQYLVAAYGPDKLNDPTQQEPILQQMIQVDPSDPANYFYLANIYEQNGDYDKAEAQFLKAKEMKPNESTVLHHARGVLRPPGRIPEDDRCVERARAARADQPRSASRHRHVLLERGVQELQADRR